MEPQGKAEEGAQRPRPPIRKELFDTLLLLLGLFLLWESADYARMARAFPRLILMAMVAFILLDMGWDFVKARRARAKADDSSRARSEERAPHQEAGATAAGPRRRGRVLMCVVLLFVFPACQYLLGFLPGSVFFFLLASWALGYRKLKGLLVSTASVAVLLYVVFVLVMESRLPPGVLTHWVWR